MRKIIVLFSLIDDYIIEFSSELNIKGYEIYSFEDINNIYSSKKIMIKIIDESIYKIPVEELIILKIYNNNSTLINKTKELILFFMNKNTIIYDCNGLFKKNSNNYFNLINDYSDKNYLIGKYSLYNSVIIANIESQFCQNNLEKIIYSYFTKKKYSFVPAKTIFNKNKSIFNFDWEQYKFIDFNTFAIRFYNMIMDINSKNIFSLIISVPNNFLPFSHTELYDALPSMVSAMIEPHVLILCLPLFKLKKPFYDEIKREIKKIYNFKNIIFINSNTTYDKYWIDGDMPITYSNDELYKNSMGNYYNNIDIFNFNDIIESDILKNRLFEVLNEKNF